MAPPVQVLTRQEVEKAFNSSDPKDCELREIAQYECTFNSRFEVVCLPFSRLFKECTVKYQDKRAKQVKTRRQMIEITTKDTNTPLRSHRKEFKDFVRTMEQLEDYMKQFDS